MVLRGISRCAIVTNEEPRVQPAALRQWLRLSADVRTRIDSRLVEFARSGKGDVRQLKGRAEARLRVGDWRVLFVDEGGTITVLAVGHRRDIYD